MYKLIAMDKQINIQEALDWYIWAGVTETCSDEVCAFNKENQPIIPKTTVSAMRSSSVLAAQVPASGALVLTSFAALKNAKDICAKATSLEELRELLEKFDGCNLKNTAASTIFGDGSNKAKIMLIGEAPGADEDRIGRPFVGRCGKLLDKMFTAIELNRADCYITNVLPWRPPGNRPPTDDEIAVCLPFLKRQIELIEPDFLLLLGGIALKSVMDCADSISRTRGKWLEYSISSQKKAYVLATYHPSYLLRSTAQKSKVWTDLLRLKKKVEEIS
ncbi:MAG: uracil-DNA glycosylase [Alphaproteobacteria bacterium]|nr:uracil-DNA glycosylase [Alphaproteobacteria bacterium]